MRRARNGSFGTLTARETLTPPEAVPSASEILCTLGHGPGFVLSTLPTGARTSLAVTVAVPPDSVTILHDT